MKRNENDNVRALTYHHSTWHEKKRSRPECLQRELVDGVDLVKVIEDEIEDRGPRCGRPVKLSGLVDLEAGLLGLGDLDFDVCCGLLRVLKVLDQCAVAQNVVTGRRKSHLLRINICQSVRMFCLIGIMNLTNIFVRSWIAQTYVSIC